MATQNDHRGYRYPLVRPPESLLIELERPIAIGVLKIKAKLGELMPAEKGGRGKKNSPSSYEGFNPNTVTAYRKLAANIDRLPEYCESIEDVPTQTEFIRFCTGAHVGHNAGEHGITRRRIDRKRA